MGKFIMYFIVIILSNILSYKFIRHIDKKERKKIQEWELDFIENIKKNNDDSNINIDKMFNENKEEENLF